MKYFILLLISITTINLGAQVKFNITLLSDEETYLVSYLAEETIKAPLHKVSNLQVVIKSEKNNPLDAIHIESLVPGVAWSNDAYFENSNPRTLYMLTAFTTTPSYLDQLIIEADTEIPLFTMKRTDGACIGTLTLPNAEDATVATAISRQLNFTQNMTVLGARGNAFAGFIQPTITCKNEKVSVPTFVTDFSLKAYPIPAKEELQLGWSSSRSVNNLQADIFNNKGQFLQSIELAPSKGKHLTQINLSDYSSGLYTIRITSDKRQVKVHKFIIQK